MDWSDFDADNENQPRSMDEEELRDHLILVNRFTKELSEIFIKYIRENNHGLADWLAALTAMQLVIVSVMCKDEDAICWNRSCDIFCDGLKEKVRERSNKRRKI